jgi:hypothetical protein
MTQKKIDLNAYAPKIFWSLLLGALIGSVGGFALAFLFVKNVWCFIGALVGGALGALEISRILTSMLGLNEHQLYHGEGITGQWIRLYWFLHSRVLLAAYGVIVGFLVTLVLLVYDSVNLATVEGKAKVIRAELDQQAAYQGDTLKGRIYLVVVELGEKQLGYYVDRDLFEQIDIDAIVQVSYYQSRLLQRIHLYSLKTRAP